MANNLPLEKKVAAVSMLAEGMSIRATERGTCGNQKTIMSPNRPVGDACQAIISEKMRDVNRRQIQVDETRGFIGAKQKNASRVGAFGEVWTFIASDGETKLIASFLVGSKCEAGIVPAL